MYAYVTYLRPVTAAYYNHTYRDWTIYSYYEYASPSATQNTIPNLANMSTRRNSTCSVRLIRTDAGKAPVVNPLITN